MTSGLRAVFNGRILPFLSPGSAKTRSRQSIWKGVVLSNHKVADRWGGYKAFRLLGRDTTKDGGSKRVSHLFSIFSAMAGNLLPGRGWRGCGVLVSGGRRDRKIETLKFSVDHLGKLLKRFSSV